MPFSAQIGDMVIPEITAYRWNKEAVKSALQAADFKGIRWIQSHCHRLEPSNMERIHLQAIYINPTLLLIAVLPIFSNSAPYVQSNDHLTLR